MPPDDSKPDEEQEEGDQPDELCSSSGPTGRMVYRAMREDAAGGPAIGPTARTLGVRPAVDVPVSSGQVRPNTGGMSVAPDRPENLPFLRRPAAYGGAGKDPVWGISLDKLGGALQFRQTS